MRSAIACCEASGERISWAHLGSTERLEAAGKNSRFAANMYVDIAAVLAELGANPIGTISGEIRTV